MKLVTSIALIATVWGLNACEPKEAKTGATPDPAPPKATAPDPIEIYKLIAQKSCAQNEDCSVLEFGSRPCGGPSDFAVYSSVQTNLSTLQKLVVEYTSEEKAYNEKLGAVGTCEALLKPSVSCHQGFCAEMDSETQSPTLSDNLIISFDDETQATEGLSQVQEILPSIQSKKILANPPTYTFQLRGGLRSQQYIPLIKQIPIVRNVEKDQPVSTP